LREPVEVEVLIAKFLCIGLRHTIVAMGSAQCSTCAEECLGGSETPIVVKVPTFRTTVERALGEKIGLKLDALDRLGLVIIEIPPGAVKEWNDACPGDKNLQVNQRIVEVNGIVGDSAAMLAAMKQSTIWHLVVQRPVEIRAVIPRDDTKSLGMNLRYSTNSTSLLIAEVEDGPIQDWNDKSSADKIKPFDRIVEVNDTRGSVESLLEAGQLSDKLNMVVLHYE